MNDNLNDIHANCEEEAAALRSQLRELQAQLDYEQERNLNSAANAQLQIKELTVERDNWYDACIRAHTRIAELTAEITRLREGGCAREQGATQYCAEAQRLAGDAAILDWIADHEVVNDVDGVNLDIHDIARKIVDNQGRQKQSTIQIYRQALRQLIRAAMDEKRNDDSGL